MPGVSFQLPIWFDLAAVFLFALTGVWAATKRGYDIVGAFVLAFVTGVGGGLMRDGIFLQEVPVVIRDGRFIWAVLAALAVGGLAQRLADRFELLIAYVDAAAIGVYAVYGANKSLVAGAPPEAAVLVGLCNAVGGGLLRDVLVREEPWLLKPGQLYFLATLVGCSALRGAKPSLRHAGRARGVRRDCAHPAAARARHPLQLENVGLRLAPLATQRPEEVGDRGAVRAQRVDARDLRLRAGRARRRSRRAGWRRRSGSAAAPGAGVSVSAAARADSAS